MSSHKAASRERIADALRREDRAGQAFFLDIWIVQMARDAGFTDAEIAFILNLDDSAVPEEFDGAGKT